MMAPPLLKCGDPCVKDIDASVKNKFRWAWLEEEVDLGLGEKYKKVRVGETLHKTKEAGSAWCSLCCKTVTYSSSGKKALLQHMKKPVHANKWKQRLDNQQITIEKDAVVSVAHHSTTLSDRVATQEVSIIESVDSIFISLTLKL